MEPVIAFLRKIVTWSQTELTLRNTALTDKAICGACAISREDSVTVTWVVGRQLVTAGDFMLL